MNTYYKVITEFYDNGTVKAAMTCKESMVKPVNSSRELPFMDAYIDWFDDKAEAEKFLAEAKSA